MKLLVTGGAGYAGSVVARLLLDAGHEVVVLDDLSNGYAEAVPDGATFVQGSVLSHVGEVLEPSFDGVFHFAAFIAAGESVTSPSSYWHNNLVSSLALLDAMRAANVTRLVFSSTANVYGAPDELPIPETAPTRPPNPYAASKLAVDHALRDWAIAYGLGAVSLRYFNVAGAHRSGDGQLIGERHDPETHLIPTALAVAAGERDVLPLFGDDYPTPDGTCVRDYIHVTDLANAHLLALTTLDRPGHRVYNLGNGNGFSNREVVDVVRAVTGREVPTAIAARRAGDPPSLVASSALAQAELGWTPQLPHLKQIVSDAWAFYCDRTDR